MFPFFEVFVQSPLGWLCTKTPENANVGEMGSYLSLPCFHFLRFLCKDSPKGFAFLFGEFFKLGKRKATGGPLSARSCSRFRIKRQSQPKGEPEACAANFNPRIRSAPAYAAGLVATPPASPPIPWPRPAAGGEVLPAPLQTGL